MLIFSGGLVEKIFIFATCHGMRLEQYLSSVAPIRDRYSLIRKINFTSPGVPREPEQYLNEIRSSKFFLYQGDNIINDDFLKKIGCSCIPIQIPYITSSIYWPSLLVPNMSKRILVNDKYPFGLIPHQCGILNKFINDFKNESLITSKYINTNIGDALDLEKHFSKQIDYLKKIDTKNEHVKISQFIENNIRQEQLFHLFNHPSGAVFQHVTEQVLKVMGFQVKLNRIPDPFEFHQIPIHPSIVNHYGLKFADGDCSYQLGSHRVNFAEYVRMYIRGYKEMRDRELTSLSIPG
jgi:hypothetical protein